MLNSSQLFRHILNRKNILFSVILSCSASQAFSETQKSGMLAGYGFGYPTVFNIILGAHYKDLIIYEGNLGANINGSRRSFTSLSYKYRQISVGCGLIIKSSSENWKSTINPSSVFKYNIIDNWIKLQASLYLAYPLHGVRIIDLYNIQINMLFYDF